MLKKLSLIVLLAVFIISCESEKKDQESGTGADPMPFIVKNGYFYKNGKTPEKMFIAGINLGIGVPGTMAGELAASKEDYLRWFSQMSEAGFNSLRIYTIHFPQFYEALNEFNTANKDKPLYLFHGIWLDEEGMENGDLFTITDHFDEGIKEAVDVVHGNAEIGHRYGRAYGTYTVDISDWIAGWIIGREVSPFEVASTNFNNENIKSFEGKHFKIGNCDPAEAWFTERLDVLAEYESEKYEVKRPLSMSSWPTLDPLKHRTEGSLSFEDTNKIDLSGIDDSNYVPGYFASYHAYPYYPNFMNTEPEYLSFSDNYGMNNYTGYLSDLKEHYKDSPLLIAEFGVPSSIGNAHFSVSGMHHGGHDETAQGNYIKRMFETIRDTGCAGGMYFAWIDEWWKRTWITDELDFPPERRPLWHNITAPEQNFGLIAFEPESGPVFKKTGEGSSAVT
ncbi:MAG TPA: family 2 glycosyl transferase, partial [bacterium]|nr:family 2 glycosyl transferase [bacterium]